jgi:hypothetical protein
MLTRSNRWLFTKENRMNAPLGHYPALLVVRRCDKMFIIDLILNVLFLTSWISGDFVSRKTENRVAEETPAAQ